MMRDPSRVRDDPAPRSRKIRAVADRIQPERLRVNHHLSRRFGDVPEPTHDTALLTQW